MPSANQRISEYVLEERVGGGTFGEVWRARHHIWNDQVVAIKIPTNSEYIHNLQREGVAIHGLVHPCIVRAMGFDPYADPPYLVMEYVPGSSLRPLIEQKNLTITDAVAIMKQVLAGLSHAHSHNLIHGDIKPENILVHERSRTEGFGAEGVIKLTDFGLGRVAKVSAESIAYSASLGGEDAKRISGTLDYMSPEQRTGGEIDTRADLYACGVVFYELLTGERPAGVELPSHLNPAVPRQYDDAFRRSYARLESRFASADEFLLALVKHGPPPIPAARAGGIGALPPLMPNTPPPLRTVQTAVRSCPGCRQAVSPNDQFCMHCGLQLVPQVRRCPQCGSYPDPTDRFCIFCGQTLAADSGLAV